MNTVNYAALIVWLLPIAIALGFASEALALFQENAAADLSSAFERAANPATGEYLRISGK